MRRPRQERNRGLLVNYPAAASGSDRPAASKVEQQQAFREEIARILGGRTIGNSELLRKLLSYLAEKWVTSDGEVLKEYTIGVEAFAKPLHYDPQEDPSARVLASKLRHKLEEYYLREGAASPYRIEMPKGRFSLRFHPAPTEERPAQLEILQSKVRRWRLAAVALAFVAVLSFFATLQWGILSRSHAWAPANPSGWSRELDMIWSPFIRTHRPLLISLGTPLFTEFSGGSFRNPKINQETEAAGSEQIHHLREQLASQYAVPSYAYTGAGEAIGVFLLGGFLQGRAEHFSIERSSTLTWDDIRHHNVIFVGPPESNLHLAEMPTDGGFDIHDGAIRNAEPRAGEQDVYCSSWAPNHTELLEDYALVSRMQGLQGSGEIMALGAASTEATWAAVEYVTQPIYARELVGRIAGSVGVLPDSYQVVIRVRLRKQVPAVISYVTHRVLPHGELADGSGQGAGQPAR